MRSIAAPWGRLYACAGNGADRAVDCLATLQPVLRRITIALLMLIAQSALLLKLIRDEDVHECATLPSPPLTVHISIAQGLEERASVTQRASLVPPALLRTCAHLSSSLSAQENCPQY
jgi:hypothetical protein